MAAKTALSKTAAARKQPADGTTEAAAPPSAFAAPASDRFYIAATDQPTTPPPRALKYGDTFAVLDTSGDIAAASGGSAGLFNHDTRYLSRLELLVNGAHPLLLGSNLPSALFREFNWFSRRSDRRGPRDSFLRA